MKLIFISSVILKLLDALTTYYAITYLGCVEVNPIIVYLMDNIGMICSLILMTIFSIVIQYIIYRKCRKTTMLIISLLLLSVVINNIYMIILS